MPTNNNLATDKGGSGTPAFIGGIGLAIPGSSAPSTGEWRFIALPEVSVSKQAVYSDIPIIGRSSPIASYAHSNYRRLQITFHLHSLSLFFQDYHLQFIRAVDSLVHPVYENTYSPPRLAMFKCGGLLAGTSIEGGSYLRILVEDTSYTLSPDVVWYGDTSLIPQYMTLQLNARVIYNFQSLPGAQDVIGGKY